MVLEALSDQEGSPSSPRRCIGVTESASLAGQEIEGLSEFKGPIIHARDYSSSNSGKKSFREKTVLVIGCGSKSGMKISLDLLNHKAFPIMVHPSLESETESPLKDRIYSKIKSRELNVVVQGIKRLNEDTVEFFNGEKVAIDVVVHATGYYNNDTKDQKRPSSHNSDFILEPITVIDPEIESALVIRNMINSTSDGLVGGQRPTLSEQGEGGAYFMRDSTGKFVAVFKPIDEEPYAVNNPRPRRRPCPSSSDGEGLKKGTRVGQGAFREVAAYLLDHPISGHRKSFGDELGFAGVPPTLMVKCLNKEFNHPGELAAKIGSLQKFVENDGTCEDFGHGLFPIKEVHKITELDIRLANADRHGGNILLIREDNGQSVLIPIDHGYCLPTTFEDCTFEWLNWPQARQPYTAETIEYIRSLDAEEDIALWKLYVEDPPIECVRTLRISTMLLKKGVERKMTPFAIGSLMCRECSDKESVIEEIVQEALNSVLPGTSEAILLDVVSQIMDRRLDEIALASLPKLFIY